MPGTRQFFLGTDSDLNADWDEGTFTDHFEGTWITIGGEYVCAYLIERTDDYNLYTIPANVNGEDINIRAVYSFEDESFHVLGTYDGVDTDTGASGRDIRPLTEGDEIVFRFEAFDSDFEETGPYETDPVTWTDEMTMEDGELIDGNYLYMLSVYDYFGNEYDGDPVAITYEDGYISVEELT